MRARKDYPHLKCEDCYEIAETEGVLPRCEREDDGCLIPSLDYTAGRALRARGICNELREFGAGNAVIERMNLSLFELELVAEIERELRAKTNG